MSWVLLIRQSWLDYLHRNRRLSLWQPSIPMMAVYLAIAAAHHAWDCDQFYTLRIYNSVHLWCHIWILSPGDISPQQPRLKCQPSSRGSILLTILVGAWQPFRNGLFILKGLRWVCLIKHNDDCANIFLTGRKLMLFFFYPDLSFWAKMVMIQQIFFFKKNIWIYTEFLLNIIL